MMTILFISSEYPPLTGNGGIGTYTKYCAEGMHNRGHKVYVICRHPDFIKERETINGINIHRIPPADFYLPKTPLLYYFRVIMRSLFYHTLVRVAWARAVRDEIMYINSIESKIDIIEYPECGAEGLLIPKHIKACKVVRLHTPWSMVKKLDDIKEQPGDELVFPLLEKHAIKKATYITSPSHAMLHSLNWNLNRSKTTVIPNPIASKNFNLTIGNGWIYTGRVEMRKGVHTLIKAYTKIFTTHSVPNLTIVGAPYGETRTGVSFESEIQNLIDNSGCSTKIIWYKGVPQEQVYALLQQSSVAFFPSQWENFSYACLEAMACGCAIVASDCGGFPEMLSHNVHGFLVPPSSPDKLTAAMALLLENPNQVRVFGKAASQFVTEHFDSDLICSKLESLFSTVIGVTNYDS